MFYFFTRSKTRIEATTFFFPFHLSFSMLFVHFLFIESRGDLREERIGLPAYSKLVSTACRRQNVCSCFAGHFQCWNTQDDWKARCYPWFRSLQEMQPHQYPFVCPECPLEIWNLRTRRSLKLEKKREGGRERLSKQAVGFQTTRSWSLKAGSIGGRHDVAKPLQREYRT